MPDTSVLPPTTILVLGVARSGRHALAHELAQRLPTATLRLAVVEHIDALPDAPPPRTLVLLLAPRDAAGETEDLRWRDALARARLPYGVLHGNAAARLATAWGLVRALLPAAQASAGHEAAATPAPSRWTWQCDKCSDPACEHRLFRDLLAERRPAAPAPY